MPRAAVPRACRFFDVLHSVLYTRGVLPICGALLPAILASTGQFRQITAQNVYVPIGGWHSDPGMQRVGKAFRGFIRRYAHSMMPFLVEAGLCEEEVDDLVKGLMFDLRRASGVVCVYHTVHARKA